MPASLTETREAKRRGGDPGRAAPDSSVQQWTCRVVSCVRNSVWAAVPSAMHTLAAVTCTAGVAAEYVHVNRSIIGGNADLTTSRRGHVGRFRPTPTLDAFELETSSHGGWAYVRSFVGNFSGRPAQTNDHGVIATCQSRSHRVQASLPP